ncbi:hypothetical protein [Actinomadura harenae]|uniref:hypothetical protein n=1 Tax=Actinomadura harenae TaxID=2483351 RepID=UPI0018F62F3D|nr:hypothetical protein [Actinomadura harenae]
MWGEPTRGSRTSRRAKRQRVGVRVLHVGDQHLLTTAHPDRTSSVVGGYMIFYSLGSALGATATTTTTTSFGWAGSSVLGAGFVVCALAVWASGRRLASRPHPVADAPQEQPQLERQVLTSEASKG